MIVGEGRSSEKGRLMHPGLLMEVDQKEVASRTGLDRQFQAEHREVMLCLVLQQLQVSEGYLATGRRGWGTRSEPGHWEAPQSKWEASGSQGVPQSDWHLGRIPLIAV